MSLRWLIASLHLLALGIGLGAIGARARALSGPLDAARLGNVFLADNLWALAAVLWIVTGAYRAFGGLEKGTAYYLASNVFWAKMAMLGLIVLLEIRPIVTLMRWRMARARGATLDLSSASVLARISVVQAGLVVGMVFAATAMARGLSL